MDFTAFVTGEFRTGVQDTRGVIVDPFVETAQLVETVVVAFIVVERHALFLQITDEIRQCLSRNKPTNVPAICLFPMEMILTFGLGSLS